MASHLETTDAPLLYSPQYITVRGRVTTVDPHVQSILSSDGPASSSGKTVPEVWDKLYGHRLNQKTTPPKCQVGDRVRLNKKHRPFKRGYLPGWTEEVFVVTHVRSHPVVTYRLSEWNGAPLKGTFYEPDVQKVQVSDD